MQTKMCPLIDGHKFQINEIHEFNLGLSGPRLRDPKIISGLKKQNFLLISIGVRDFF